jgi:hypothetical protein
MQGNTLAGWWWFFAFLLGGDVVWEDAKHPLNKHYLVQKVADRA